MHVGTLHCCMRPVQWTLHVLSVGWLSDVYSNTHANCSGTLYAMPAYRWQLLLSHTHGVPTCYYTMLMKFTSLCLRHDTTHCAATHSLCLQMLYVPTDWVHSIVNLGVNAQCNARSGATRTYRKVIAKCQPGRPPGQRPQQQQQHMQPASW
jgi:hypothetical protein